LALPVRHPADAAVVAPRAVFALVDQLLSSGRRLTEVDQAGGVDA
jgi:hypothetical protein